MVEGRYEVDRLLGVGGMGAVVAATDVDTGERVAIKCLLPEHCTHDDVVARFHREARATFRLQNEHVARVFDTGTLPSGIPYIVMEHLDGRDLKSLVKAHGPLSAKDAAAFVCQACVALAEAHALGIVHRDLKPANLFLTRRPNGAAVIKVLDFGIAKFLSPNIAGDQLEMTRTRAVLGSRAYMAPEQMLRPKEVDARADVWALGVILYFLVIGKNPFAAETTEALILSVVQGQPHPMSELRPGLPEGFEAIVLRCLSKAREKRFPNVTELARALAPFARAPLSDDDRATIPLPEPGPPSSRGYAFSSISSIDRPLAHGSWDATKIAPARSRRVPAGILGAALGFGALAVGLLLHLRVPAALPTAHAIAAAAPVPDPPAAAPPAIEPAIVRADHEVERASEVAATATATATAKLAAPAPTATEPATSPVRPAAAPKPARPRSKPAPLPDSPW